YTTCPQIRITTAAANRRFVLFVLEVIAYKQTNAIQTGLEMIVRNPTVSIGSPSKGSGSSRSKATHGVTITLVSCRERKRRQPGLATDDPTLDRKSTRLNSSH